MSKKSVKNMSASAEKDKKINIKDINDPIEAALE